MGEVVDLHGQPVQLEDDLEFISDLARYAEGLFSEQDVKKKHHLPPILGSASAATKCSSRKLKPRK